MMTIQANARVRVSCCHGAFMARVEDIRPAAEAPLTLCSNPEYDGARVRAELVAGGISRVVLLSYLVAINQANMVAMLEKDGHWFDLTGHEHWLEVVGYMGCTVTKN